MSAKNAYQAHASNVETANATAATALGTALNTLHSALAAAEAAYTTNDGGKYAAAIAAAHAAYDTSVATATSAREAAIVSSGQQMKSALSLP